MLEKRQQTPYKPSGPARNHRDPFEPVKLTVNYSRVHEEKFFKWGWKIEDFSVKKIFTKRFSIDNGKVIMKVEWKPFVAEKFIGTSAIWCFEKVDPSMIGKTFALEIGSEIFPKCLLDLTDKIQTGRSYGSFTHYISNDDYKNYLKDEKTINFNFKMHIDSGLGHINSDNFELLAHDESLLINPVSNRATNKSFTDYEFTVEGEKVPVHRVILAANNPKFAEEQGKPSFAEVKDVPKAAFENFISHFYANRVTEISKYMDKYIMLAGKFGITEQVTQKFIDLSHAKLSEDTAWDILQKAWNFGFPEDLQQEAFAMLQKKFLGYNRKLHNRLFHCKQELTEIVEELEKFEGIMKKYSHMVVRMRRDENTGELVEIREKLKFEIVRSTA